MSGFTQSGETTGTFTPGFSFGGGTTGIAYNTGQTTGTWVRRGSLMWIEGRVTVTAKGSSTGVMRITGLPVSTSACAVIVGYYGSFASLSGGIAIRAEGGTTLRLQTHSAATIADLSDTNATSGSDVTFMGILRV